MPWTGSKHTGSGKPFTACADLQRRPAIRPRLPPAPARKAFGLRRGLPINNTAILSGLRLGSAESQTKLTGISTQILNRIGRSTDYHGRRRNTQNNQNDHDFQQGTATTSVRA